MVALGEYAAVFIEEKLYTEEEQLLAMPATKNSSRKQKEQKIFAFQVVRHALRRLSAVLADANACLQRPPVTMIKSLSAAERPIETCLRAISNFDSLTGLRCRRTACCRARRVS